MRHLSAACSTGLHKAQLSSSDMTVDHHKPPPADMVSPISAPTHSTTDAMSQVNANQPPSYDLAMSGMSPSAFTLLGEAADLDTESGATDKKPPLDAKLAPQQPQQPRPQFQMGAGPSRSGPMVYHYQSDATGHQITTFLPPDHPEMICLQEGRHIKETKYGLLGVLAAVFWFPLGVGLCILDRRVRCRRCGQSINDGLAC